MFFLQRLDKYVYLALLAKVWSAETEYFCFVLHFRYCLLQTSGESVTGGECHVYWLLSYFWYDRACQPRCDIIPDTPSIWQPWGLSLVITVTPWWARWRLKSPASRVFAQPFIQAQIKENIKAPRHWPVCGEFTGDRWIPRTRGRPLTRKILPFDDVIMHPVIWFTLFI